MPSQSSCVLEARPVFRKRERSTAEARLTERKRVEKLIALANDVGVKPRISVTATARQANKERKAS